MLKRVSLMLLLAGCSTGTPPQPESLASLSPAQNCEAQGGKRRAERGADGHIGVCVFPDNRQCEEWALLLGECPRGGIPVAGYATTSERHCAIRGGRMTIPGCAVSPVGMYEGPAATLVLQAGRTALVRTGGGPGGRTLLGTWERSGSVVTVRTELERLVLDYAGDRLIPREWDRKLWGAQGPGALARQR